MTDRPLHIRLFRMLIGAGVGLVFCTIGAATGFLEWMATLAGEDLASVGLALVLLFLAAFALIVSSHPRIYRAMAENYRDGDPSDAHVLRTLRVSGIIMVISGGLLLAPTLAVRLGADESLSVAVAAAMGVLVLIQTWLSIRVVRRSDELTKAANAESCIVSFWVTQLGLFGWAALAKLALVPEPTLWTLMIIGMGAFLVISIGVSIRRGLFA